MFISHTQLSNYPASQRVILKRYFSSKKNSTEKNRLIPSLDQFFPNIHPFYINTYINILRSSVIKRKKIKR